MTSDRKSLIGTIFNLNCKQNDTFFTLMIKIYCSCCLQYILLVMPKTLTYFEKVFPKQGDTQITVTAPETDYKRNTTINKKVNEQASGQSAEMLE